MESCVNLPTYLDSFGCPVFICKQNSLQFFLILNFTSMDSYGMHSSGTYFCHSVVWFLDSANMMHLVLVHSSSLLCSIPLFSSVQSLSHVWLFATPWTACSTPGFPVHYQLLELTQTHVHRAGDAIQPSHPLFSPSPPAFNLSQHQGLFQWVSSSHQVAKILEFQLQHQSFQWIFGTSFRMYWLDLLAVQGTLKSLLQHHSSKASIKTCYFPLFDTFFWCFT